MLRTSPEGIFGKLNTNNNDGPSGPSFFVCKRKPAAGEALLVSFGLLTVGAGEKGGRKRLTRTVSMQNGLCVQLSDEKREKKFNSTDTVILAQGKALGVGKK